MRIAKRAALAVAGILVLAVLVAFVLPRHAIVVRSTEIDAPPAAIYTLVGDLRHFNEWSPWSDLDPDTSYTFTGAVDGVGQTLNWQSDDPDVGSGSMEIVGLDPDRRVDLALHFGAEGEAISSLRLEPAGTGTSVTWTFDSDLGFNPIARYFGLIIDGRIGPDYEKGLAKLKAVVESPPPPTDG